MVIRLYKTKMGISFLKSLELDLHINICFQLSIRINPKMPQKLISTC